MSGYQLDGNDVIEVYRAAGEAVARARKGGGPSLLECKTYRTRAHAEGMGDFTYRTKEEVQEWKQRCPIARLKSHRQTSDLLGSDSSAFDQIDSEVKEVVKQARVQAEASPEPSAESATLNIYAPARAIPSNGNRNSDAKRVISFAQGTLEALAEEMASNPKIFVMGEGIGVRGGNFVTTKGLYDLYGPDRLCDTPICERGFVGLACGAAMTGTRPVIDFMFADFVLDGFGEIINQIAKMQYMSSGRLRMPVLLRGCIGIGHSAATHHSGSYYGMLAQVPGLRVVVPSMAADAKGLFKHALRCDDPVLFLEHRELLQTKEAVPDGDFEIEFGKARIVREGKSVTVVAIARMVHLTMSVCDSLEAQGISVELIDPRTVNPLDTETILGSLTKTGRLLVVDEAPAHCGFSAEIAARMADIGFDELDAPIKRHTGLACPTPYSPSLEKMVIPSAESIASAIRELVEE
jgi:2-oxoisovalerate dehydrogenase E1 component